MGRLATEYAGRKITFRVPYSMPGELIVDASSSGVQFPEATFLHNIDKPFEIHRIIPRVTAIDAGNLVYTAGAAATVTTLLEMCTRIRIFDFSKNENLTKNAQLIHSLYKGDSEKTWEFADPYTLVRSEGFQVTVDNIATAGIVGGAYAKTRVELTFQGFLCVVSRPDER